VDSKLLRRRLIGASVLVALGVIFIPMILSGGRDEMPLFGSNIPDKPKAIKQLKSLDIPRPKAVEKSAEIRIPVDEHLPPAKVEPATIIHKDQLAPPKSSKSVDKNPLIKSWVVQVGSFGNRANALALQKKLRGHKFPAFVEFVKNRKGSVYRVRVGPEVKRSRSEATRQAIQKKLKIKGVVMNHP